MTKEVMVTISGIHFLDEEGQEDAIELVHIGEYYEQNGAYYILFEEILEGISQPVKNIVKIREGCLEVRKKGPVTVNMIFEEGKTIRSTYAVPYGSFLLEICTRDVTIRQEEELLQVDSAYELSVNGEHCAECNICVKVEPRENFRL